MLLAGELVWPSCSEWMWTVGAGVGAALPCRLRPVSALEERRAQTKEKKVKDEEKRGGGGLRGDQDRTRSRNETVLKGGQQAQQSAAGFVFFHPRVFPPSQTAWFFVSARSISQLASYYYCCTDRVWQRITPVLITCKIIVLELQPLTGSLRTNSLDTLVPSISMVFGHKLCILFEYKYCCHPIRAAKSLFWASLSHVVFVSWTNQIANTHTPLAARNGTSADW